MVSPWYLNFSIATGLQVLLLWRALRARLWSIYPFFYAYVLYASLTSVAFALPVVTRHPGYVWVYWWAYFTAAVLRFGVAGEIYRYTFPVDSPLRVRVSVITLCAMLFLPFAFWTFMSPSQGSSPFPDGIRKLALTVMTVILLILGTARFYGLGIGRNVWAMATGLLVLMGSDLMDLAAMDLFPRLQVVCGYVHPVAFNFMLIVWSVGLWRYCPNPSRPILSRAAAQELVGICEHQWAQVSNVFRNLVKP